MVVRGVVGVAKFTNMPVPARDVMVSRGKAVVTVGAVGVGEQLAAGDPAAGDCSSPGSGEFFRVGVPNQVNEKAQCSIPLYFIEAKGPSANGQSTASTALEDDTSAFSRSSAATSQSSGCQDLLSPPLG